MIILKKMTFIMKTVLFQGKATWGEVLAFKSCFCEVDVLLKS